MINQSKAKVHLFLLLPLPVLETEYPLCFTIVEDFTKRVQISLKMERNISGIDLGFLGFFFVFLFVFQCVFLKCCFCLVGGGGGGRRGGP